LRLRTLLTLLVLTTLVPLGLFAGLLIGRFGQQQRAIVERQNVETARAISVAVDQQVESGRSALQVLAMLEIFDSLEPAWLNRLALRLIPGQPGWYAMVLAAPSGHILFDTSARSGEAPQLGEREWIYEVVRTHRSAVSNLFQDVEAGGYFYMIAVPVMDSGAVKFVLAAKVRSTSLSEILRRQGAPPGGVVTLIDRTPRIMARSRSEAEFVGKAPSENFRTASLRMSEGTFQGRLLEGIPSYSSLSRSPITGWTVGIGMPADSIAAPIRRSIWELALVGVALLGAGIISALILGRALVGALTSASQGARGLARGDAVEAHHSHIHEAEELSQGLLEAAAILNVRLRERDQALLAADTARREAETLNRSKDEFVATMSHELRTPLNAIYGWVRLLRSGKLDAGRHEHALEVIERNTRAQTQLIEDLLDMSRIVTGKLRLEMRRVDLAAALQSAVEGLRPTAVAKEIEIALNLRPGVGPVTGDPDRLRQIVTNLLTNSLKFTGKGGRIEVLLDAEGSDAIVRVTDNGSGIAPDLLPHIFERFRQGSTSPGRTHGGLGIGLALVRHLVEMHGGTVVAASDGDGRGASLTIRLPMLGQRAIHAMESQESSLGRDSTDTLLLDRVQVLVLEDDPDARDLIATTLRQAGALVTAVASMPEALEFLTLNIPQVAVSDIAMPNGTGYDFVKQLRSMPHTAKVPAIALTAYARTEDRMRSLEAGFDSHIGKPVDPPELVRAVAAAVARGQ
jgi:signal transduction histidine kinase/CheY-like chemotaxis protein